MPTKRLTKRKIENAEFDPEGPQKQILWDEKLSGFGVRLNPGGSKSFLIWYRNEHNRLRHYTLGKFGELTLKQARDMARDKLYEVRKGEDPRAERQAKQNAETVEDLAHAFVEKYSKPRKKSWKKDRNRLERHIIPVWGNRAPAEIQFNDVDKLHRKIGEKEGKIYEANRTLEVIRKMFNWASKAGYVPQDHNNPAAPVESFKEKGRERRLHRDEIPALFDAIKEEKNEYMRSVFWTLLLTGCRRSEVLEMKWENVNFSRREIYIPDTKNDTSHTVPITPHLDEILKDLPRQKNNPYVFCGRKKASHLVNIDKAWGRICERAGFDNLRIHDLRRTVGSWLGDLGYSPYIVKKVLNHAVPDITGVYTRVGQDPIRDALEQYAEHLFSAAEPGDSVVPMDRRKGAGS
jgi:integrase